MDKVEELKELLDSIAYAADQNPGPFTPMRLSIDRTRAYLNGDEDLPSLDHLRKAFKPIEDLYMESARGGIRGSRLREIAPSNQLGFDARNIINAITNDEFDSIKEQIARHRVVPVKTVATPSACSSKLGSSVFVGHGGSPLYHQVLTFLRDTLKLETETFERNKLVGGQVIPVLQKMLDNSGFAAIVATAEDDTLVGRRARQNVVHEIGLFQGRLGFERVAILCQEGVELWSNTDGLLMIRFEGDDINTTFLELQQALQAMDII